MIVTCPGCNSKYRVRDEAVPAAGAELKCPSCASVFVAHPPKHSKAEIETAIEKVHKVKESIDERASQLDSAQRDFDRRGQEVERREQLAQQRAQDAERRVVEVQARLTIVDTSVFVLKGELATAKEDARAAAVEFARMKDDVTRANMRAAGAGAAENRVLALTEELARAKAAVISAPEIVRLKDELTGAKASAQAMRDELEKAHHNVQALRAELTRASRLHGDDGRVVQLEADIARLRHQLQNQGTVPPGPAMSPTLASLVAAVAPMLWGLDQAMRYLEPFAASEAALAGHLKQLQLLHGVLTRLTQEARGAGG